MPFLVPQLATLGDDYDGTRPLPARLERIARLDADFVPTRTIAKQQRVSVNSVVRLRRQDAYAARRAYLAQRAAERAAKEAPLSYKGNRIAMLDKHARKLSEDLIDNDYITTVGIDKGGNVIEGFDTNRVGQLTKLVMAIDAMTEGRRSTIVEAHTTTNNVVLTTDQVVTRVQALLSRTEQPAEAGTPGAPLGVEGGMFGTDTMDKDASGSAQGPDQNSEAKGILEAEYREGYE